MLGILAPEEFLRAEYILDVEVQWFERERGDLLRAWEMLRRSRPDATWAPHSMAFPVWGQAGFLYYPRGDFEQALWLLFGESWRAKVCAKCFTYFVAQKPAQLYCTVQCSSASHRVAALKYWREKGAKARRASLNRKERMRK